MFVRWDDSADFNRSFSKSTALVSCVVMMAWAASAFSIAFWMICSTNMSLTSHDAVLNADMRSADADAQRMLPALPAPARAVGNPF
jgi:hypothetical protein